MFNSPCFLLHHSSASITPSLADSAWLASPCPVLPRPPLQPYPSSSPSRMLAKLQPLPSNKHTEPVFFFFFLAMSRSFWDLSSLIRDQTLSHCSISTEYQPLNCPGIPAGPIFAHEFPIAQDTLHQHAGVSRPQPSPQLYRCPSLPQGQWPSLLSLVPLAINLPWL